MSDCISNIKTSIVIITTMIGVGVYYTPFSYSESGILFGTGIMCLATLCSILSIFYLLKSAKKFQDRNKTKSRDFSTSLNTKSLNNEEYVEIIEMNDIGNMERSNSPEKMHMNKQIDLERSDNTFEENEEISGKVTYSSIGESINMHFGRLINALIMISGFSSALFYQKFISKISTKLCGYSEISSEYPTYYSGFAVLYGFIVFGFLQFRNLSKLRWLSYFSMLCMCVVCITIIVITFLFKEFVSKNEIEYFNTGFFSPLVNFIFALNCQVNLVEIFSQLKNTSKRSLITIAVMSSTGAAFFYGIIGIVGYFLFGKNMPNSDIVNIIVDSSSDIRKFIDQHYSNLLFIPNLIGGCVIGELLVSSVFQLSAVTNGIIQNTRFKNFNINLLYPISTFIIVGLMTIINLTVHVSLETVFMFIGTFVSIPLSLLIPAIFAYVFTRDKTFRVKVIFGAVVTLLIGLIITNPVVYFMKPASHDIIPEYNSNTNETKQTY